MSKQSNIINSILRQQELKFSTEGLNEGALNGTLDFDLTVESLLDELNTLTGFKKDISLAGGINRQQALSLEGIDGFKLPFPSRGFTVEPSRTGLALTNESIAEHISAGFKKLLELLAGLFDKLMEHLFGGKVRAEKARDEAKEAKRDLAEAAASAEPADTLTTESMLRVIRRVTCLSVKSEAYKGICKDLRKLRPAIEALKVTDGEIDMSQYDLTNLRFTAKKAGITLYKDDSTPDRQQIKELLTVFFNQYESSISVPGYDRSGKLINAKDAQKFFDTHYDKAMATLSVIENTLIELYMHGKEVKQAIKRLSDFREVPGMANSVAEVLKLSRCCFYLINWLNRTFSMKVELKEGV